MLCVAFIPSGTESHGLRQECGGQVRRGVTAMWVEAKWARQGGKGTHIKKLVGPLRTFYAE